MRGLHVQLVLLGAKIEFVVGGGIELVAHILLIASFYTPKWHFEILRGIAGRAFRYEVVHPLWVIGWNPHSFTKRKNERFALLLRQFKPLHG